MVASPRLAVMGQAPLLYWSRRIGSNALHPRIQPHLTAPAVLLMVVLRTGRYRACASHLPALPSLKLVD